MEKDFVTFLTCVNEFTQVFAPKKNETPYDIISLLANEQRVLRYTLQKEEIDEYINAVKQNNHTEMLDGIIDNLYICVGSIIAHKIPNFHQKIIQEQTTPITNIHQILSNDLQLYINGKINSLELIDMFSKIYFFFVNEYNKYESLNVFKPNSLVPAFLEVHASNMSKLDDEGKPIYRKDGKVLKGPNFFRPNLKQFIL